MRHLCLILSCFFTTSVLAADTVYLFRHAEKIKQTPNPGLTEQGHIRARSLCGWLKDKNITAIYSSDYLRTRQTVMPLSKTLKLSVNAYNPRQLPDLVEVLSNQSGSVVVVGHSNTIPDTVRLLGGKAHDIDESDFDNIWQVNTEPKTVTSQHNQQSALFTQSTMCAPSND